ncbi:hypothetical protein TrCOL_g12951 [Triparma columacea]|uniref:Sulfotransferase domain-containing protein n=1 Tax=Triparma columacea TaxID=722753 RepID=A0A9W7LDF3_9STRA|nr:hypothetical protein TrCOL_g12951 [Triparma columacea]
MLRLLISSLTRIHTGSDSLPSRTLCWSLSHLHGLPGEGVVDHRVNVVKTHWPERKGWWGGEGRRAVVVVRNYWDTVKSYWNMCVTNTHDKRATEEVKIMWGEKWRRMVKNEAKVWRVFHEWWMEEGRVEDICVLRFEDIVGGGERRNREIERLMRFIEGGEGGGIIGGERNRNNAKAAAASGYKVKPGGVGKAMKDFTEEMVADANEEAGEMLRMLGYEDVCKGGAVRDVDMEGIRDAFNRGRKKVEDKLDGTVRINKGQEIRREDDEFGRKMTEWRRSKTDNDTKPFPTVER